MKYLIVYEMFSSGCFSYKGWITPVDSPDYMVSITDQHQLMLGCINAYDNRLRAS